MRRTVELLATIALSAIAGVSSCADPTHLAEVNALGPESPGVSPGPMHRPGQPCLTCHGGDGPAGATFVTAGTVYADPYQAGTTTYLGLNSAAVHLVDATGSTYDTTTNSAGNFYVTPDAWNPTFPLGARSMDAGLPANGCVPTGAGASTDPYAGQIGVALPPSAGCLGIPNTMVSAIDRGGVYASCAYCHFDPPGPQSPGHLYAPPPP
jgi:hypothetical protein